MLAWPPIAQAWHEHLAGGDIVVVLAPVAGPIADARSVSRQICSELLVRFPSHRTSRSATEGLAAAAISKSDHIGVDVEHIDPQFSLSAELLDTVLDPAERSMLATDPVATFHRVWTCKESALKAAGVGLALAPSSVHVGCETDDWKAVDFGSRASPAWVRSLAAPPGFAIAIATLGALRNSRVLTVSSTG